VNKAVAALAALATAGSAHAAPLSPANYTYQIINNPRSSDDIIVRQALQKDAQGMSDRLFQALSAILGGSAPRLNFVATGSPLTPRNTSVNLTDSPYAPMGVINADPTAVNALINPNSAAHSSAVLAFPHEMAHLRQTADVLANIPQREGGAQAFTDTVTPVAAQRAGIPFRMGNYDGPYAQFVQQANQLGRDWIMAGQFGHPTPAPSWP
jgi:hypothetical protein